MTHTIAIQLAEKKYLVNSLATHQFFALHVAIRYIYIQLSSLVTIAIVTYHIAQNFGGRKLWQFETNPPKFYLPTIFILAILICCTRQSICQCFAHYNTYWQRSARVLCHTVATQLAIQLAKVEMRNIYIQLLIKLALFSCLLRTYIQLRIVLQGTGKHVRTQVKVL